MANKNSKTESNRTRKVKRVRIKRRTSKKRKKENNRKKKVM